MIHSAPMRAALLVMMIVMAVPAGAADWAPGQPVPAGPLLERPVVLAVLVRHDRPVAEAQAALGEIAQARFPEIAVVREAPKGPGGAGPLAHAAALDAAKQPLPGAPALDYTARRLEPAERARLSATRGVLVVSFLIDPARRTDLAQVCALAHAVAEKLGGFLEDGDTRDVFTPAQWKSARLDSWQGAIPAVAGHVAIQPWKRGEHAGVEVLGLRRFGLPDLALDGIGEDDASAAASLLMYVAQALAEKPVADLGALTVRAASLLHAKMRAPRGSPGGALVRLVVDAPGPVNPRRLALVPNTGETAPAMVTRLLAVLAGPPVEVAMPAHLKAALDAARAHAQPRIRELARLWQSKPPPGAELLLKAPFKSAAGREWMWLQVERWEPGRVVGKLLNAPTDVPGIAEGQSVTVSDADLYDYQYTAPGAEPEGGATDRVIAPADDE